MIEKYTTKQFEITRNPQLYYMLMDVIQSVDDKQLQSLAAFQKKLKTEIIGLSKKEEILQSASDNFVKEAVIKLQSRNSPSIGNEDAEEFHEQTGNFITLLAVLVKNINESYKALYSMSKELRPPLLLSIGERIDIKALKNREDMQVLLQEMAINGEVVQQYANVLATLHHTKEEGISEFAAELIVPVEQYYKMLVHRHTSQGVKIFTHPIITDLAIKIYKNIDASGEIESRKSDKVSAYTIRKAQILAQAMKDDLVHGFISKPDTFIGFLIDAITQLSNMGKELHTIFYKQIDDLNIDSDNWMNENKSLADSFRALEFLNPSDISFVESNRIRNEAQKMMDEIEEKTISEVVELLLNKKADFNDLVNRIMERKSELVKFVQDENSFYVCQIGAGNAFSGKSVGALEIIPAQKPRANLDWILGSGFKEIKDFLGNIKTSHQWHELYLATSPSKTVDKNNVLLIGAMGCGKSEILRAVGADNSSISIAAQGSDFFTAWAGEAQKNPKRLFEAGLKLSNESGKHVHFLIDEFDDVVNNDKDHLKHFDLTKEFQILMDGVVSYPNLSIWGATNNPERIPMPMIRRFSKVLIVGELNFQERKDLLKYYIGHMPLAEFNDSVWDDAAKLLEGATGDVVRKVADELWRTHMRGFITNKPEVAADISLFLRMPKSGKLHKELEAIKLEKNEVVKTQDFEAAARLRAREKLMIGEFEKLSKGEIPFHVDTFDRKAFKQKLRKHVALSGEEILNAVKVCLNNVGIKSEIETAIKTYKRAKEVISIASHSGIMQEN